MFVQQNKQYILEECCECGIDFGFTASFQANLKKTKQTFYCPNGHAQSYTKSTADILREKLTIEEQKNCDLVDENNRLIRENQELTKPKRKPRKKVAKNKS